MHNNQPLWECKKCYLNPRLNPCHAADVRLIVPIAQPARANHGARITGKTVSRINHRPVSVLSLWIAAMKAKLLVPARYQFLLYPPEPIYSFIHLGFASKSKSKTQVMLVMPSF